MISTTQAIDAAIKKIQLQISATDIVSDDLLSLGETLAHLVARRKHLEKLEDKRDERIASIRREHEDKVAELPTIAGVEAIKESVVPNEIPEPARIVSNSIKIVKIYMKQYLDEYPRIGWENFCHAVGCSYLGKYVSTTLTEKSIDEKLADLLSEIKMPAGVKLPLSLATVDRLIHSPSFSRNKWIVILDTSLRVILTNVSEWFPYRGHHLVIYDSELNSFAPIAGISNQSVFCQNCYCFKTFPYDFHNCQQHCPICLRPGLPHAIGCVNQTPDSVPRICFVCNAHCQTQACFDAHSKICLHSRFSDFMARHVESLIL